MGFDNYNGSIRMGAGLIPASEGYPLMQTSDIQATESGVRLDKYLNDLVISSGGALALTNGTQYLKYELYYGASAISIGIGECKESKIEIGSIVMGLPVTGIADNAFDGCVQLTEVKIPGSVETIGNRAFRACVGLTSIDIPKGVTTIGDEAFSDCINLESVTIPSSVTSISASAFKGCTKLSAITVDAENEYYQSEYGNLYTKDGTVLVRYAPGRTGSASTVWEATSIGSYAFESANNLIDVTMLDSVTEIGDYALLNCSGLITSTFFGVNTIGEAAFQYCGSLVTLGLGEELTEIGLNAFDGCTSLTTIFYEGTSPTEWESISIAEGNDYLKNARVYYYSETEPEYAGNYWHYVDGMVKTWNVQIKSLEMALSEDKNYYTVTGMGDFLNDEEVNIVIPPVHYGKPVTHIKSNTFSNRSNIKSVVISDSVTNIGNEAFSDCINLKSVTIGKGVSSLGTRAFGSCSSLESIEVSAENKVFASDTYKAYLLSKSGTVLYQYALGEKENRLIPNSISTIAPYAFEGCTLTVIALPQSVLRIGESAFENTKNLETLTIYSGLGQIGKNAFSNSTVSKFVIVGQEGDIQNISISAGNENLLRAEIVYEIPENELEYQLFTDRTETCYIVTGIGGLADAKEITIPSTYNGREVRIIGDSAFRRCTNLLEVTISDGILRIDNNAFAACVNLEKVDIPDSVTFIGKLAFNACQKLLHANLSSNIIAIHASTFLECYNLSSIDIPDNVIEIMSGAFYRCINLESVTIPSSVTSISASAFKECINLRTVKYKGSQEEWNKIVIDPMGNGYLLYAEIKFNQT